MKFKTYLFNLKNKKIKKLENLAPKNLKVVTIEELYSFLSSQKK